MPENIYVAGASSRARTTKAYLEYLYPYMRVRAFLVSPEMTDNSDMVDGVSVLKISRDSGINYNFKVYLGTRGINHNKLINELMDIGFKRENIIPVSAELDTKLRNDYVKKKFGEAGKSFVKFEELATGYLDRGDNNLSVLSGVGAAYHVDPGKVDSKFTYGDMCDADGGVLGGVLSDACIYIASSIYDSKLSDPYTPLLEEMPIMVGAALTDERLTLPRLGHSAGVVSDDTGDNISLRNRQFCELTGLYWIWKNAPQDIVGLVHYRRHFLLPVDWAGIFLKKHVDVILPVPLFVAPSIVDNYRHRHVSDDWNIMMDVIKERYPEEYASAKEFFKDGLYSPCNMLIARKKVLDEMCAWMFPVLFDVVERIGEHSDKYQNRYPGFMSERLITFFFENRRDRYRVIYADKNFLA